MWPAAITNVVCWSSRTWAPAGMPKPVLHTPLITGWFMNRQGSITWDIQHCADNLTSLWTSSMAPPKIYTLRTTQLPGTVKTLESSINETWNSHHELPTYSTLGNLSGNPHVVVLDFGTTLHGTPPLCSIPPNSQRS